MTLLALLVLFPCCAALFVGSVSHAMLWYESRGTPHEERLRAMARMAGLPLPLWLLRRVLTASGSQFLLMITYPLGWIHPLWRDPGSRKGAREEPCLILLHGLYHNPAAWLLARGRFARAGYGRQHVLTYGSWRQSFEEVAADLARDVRAIVAANPGRRIILVGHSLGGLLLRRLLAEADIAEACAALVTMGSPHRGSRLAAFGPGRLVRDVHPSSDTIRRMQTPPPSSKVPCLALVSPADAMVLPPDNLMPPDGSGFDIRETILCDHVQMLFHPHVAAQITEWLGHVIPVRPG